MRKNPACLGDVLFSMDQCHGITLFFLEVLASFVTKENEELPMGVILSFYAQLTNIFFH